VAALQETKWFGVGVYRVGESMVLAAGRAVPGEGVVRQRRGSGHCAIWACDGCLEGGWQQVEGMEFKNCVSNAEGS